MGNPMDKMPFVGAPYSHTNNTMDVIQNARHNPIGFEEHIKTTNPRGYEMACRIRNSPNPRQAILQLAQERGMDPNILKMFGII